MESTIRKRVPGLSDRYEAGDDGRLYRLAGTYETTFKGKAVSRLLPAKVLAGDSLSSKGYLRVNLEGRVQYLHRLIAVSFVPNPEGLPHINHKNGDKTDNRPANLEWVSNAQNRRHAVETGLQARGAAVSERLTERDVLRIRALVSAGASQRVVAEAFGVVQQTISHIVRRSTWAHI